MEWHWADAQEKIRISRKDKLYPVETEANDIRKANRNNDELESLDASPNSFEISERRRDDNEGED